MSQRIADCIEVLDLIHQLARQYPNSSVLNLRNKAISHVASRGVENETVYAHLVGKNTAHTLDARGIDKHISDWLNSDSNSLENWLRKFCDGTDKIRVNQFFKSVKNSQFAIDLNEPKLTEKTLITTYRILRDTALARRIKADQNYECQICSTSILLNNMPYAEAHHIRPLGSPHDGPDLPGNLVCVCPNCHVKLDYGAIRISQTMFNNVLPEFISYHNEVVCKNSA